MQSNLAIIKKALHSAAEQKRANIQMFFKTGKGDYAEHEQFIGVSVRTVRSIARQFKQLPIDALQALLQSPFNEERLLALFILVIQYKKAEIEQKSFLYTFYLENSAYINNWNLVDSSAHYIIGPHIQNTDKKILSTLAGSAHWWHRRMAIIATWHFIKQGDLNHTFSIATLLLHDTHDLIHKAVGWMLRECGKKNRSLLLQFLDSHITFMPRTMVRYAIEKCDQSLKKKYSPKK